MLDNSPTEYIVQAYVLETRIALMAVIQGILRARVLLGQVQ